MPIRSLPALALIAAAVALAGIPAAQAQATVAVFDPQRVSEETAEGRRLATYLQTLKGAKQKELSDREQEIGALQEQLSNRALSLSLDKRADMEIEIQRKLLQINAAKDLAERELQLEAAGAQARFNEKLLAVVNQFGRDSEFGVILAVDAVAWASQSVDVTTAIIDAFDKMYPAAPPPANP